ncbi:MAG: Ca2+-dependent phosphoinositide-specific phospholipase C [Flavitalea sp.]
MINATDTFLHANHSRLPGNPNKSSVITMLRLVCCLVACKTLEDRLPINHFQVIGSHNSYKQAIDPALFAMLSKKDSGGPLNIDYSHTRLADQLNLGLRNLEIDIYADTNGGKYAYPKGLYWVKEQAPYPDTGGVINEPGFKVMLIPDIDFRSNCLTFKQCVQELKSWSAAHKDHYPVFITMNAKDDTTNEAGYTHPESKSIVLTIIDIKLFISIMPLRALR